MNQVREEEWEELEGNRVNLAKRSDPIIGYFQGIQQIENRKDKDKMQNLYLIQEESSKDILAIYGFADLNEKMAGVPKGSRVRLVYKGKEPKLVQGSMMDCHKVSVQVDRKYKIPGSGEEIIGKKAEDDEQVPF